MLGHQSLRCTSVVVYSVLMFEHFQSFVKNYVTMVNQDWKGVNPMVSSTMEFRPYALKIFQSLKIFTTSIYGHFTNKLHYAVTVRTLHKLWNLWSLTWTWGSGWSYIYQVLKMHKIFKNNLTGENLIKLI